MKIGVIMGGISSEREVSLKSGKEILDNINKTKYNSVSPIIINSKKDVIEKVENIDFAFLALHGKFGEDGSIQGMLESLNIPYSGCGILSSAVCMDKALTKTIIKGVGVPTAPWIVVKSIEEIDYEEIEKMGYPVFIKPNNGGSSVATFYVKSTEEVEICVREGLKYDNKVIIEKFINGEEITSFILNGEVFPTLIIKAKNGEFFDYSSKYDEGGAEEIPVYLPKAIQQKVDKIAKKCWDELGCAVYSRVDMILSEGIPYVLEVNTLPGMTETSLSPKSAKARGIEFSELLDKIIEYSIIERGLNV